METSRPLSIESFSYSWLANLKPSFESSAGNSFRESLDESSSFIEMDPKLSSSKRFFRVVPQDLDFDFPVLSQTPRTLVHADELISNGLLMPLFVKQLKPQAYDDDDDDDDTSDSVPNSQISSFGPPEKLHSGKKNRCSSLRRCRKLSKRIFQKYLDFLRPLCRRVRGRSGSRVGTTDVKSWEYNYSTSTSPRASVAYSGDNWRRSCDSESSIYEAVLHCKRTIGQENH